MDPAVWEPTSNLLVDQRIQENAVIWRTANNPPPWGVWMLIRIRWFQKSPSTKVMPMRNLFVILSQWGLHSRLRLPLHIRVPPIRSTRTMMAPVMTSVCLAGTITFPNGRNDQQTHRARSWMLPPLPSPLVEPPPLNPPEPP